MLSHRNRVWRAAGVTLLGLGALFAQSSSVEAGGFFRRMFYRQQCQPQQYYQAPVQAAPGSVTTPSGTYQSNSFEPGTVAPAPAVVAPSGSSSYKSSYDQFRGDRKALGRHN